MIEHTKENIQMFLDMHNTIQNKVNQLVRFHAIINHPKAVVNMRFFEYDKELNKINVEVEMYQYGNTDFSTIVFKAAYLYDEELFAEFEAEYNAVIKAKKDKENEEKAKMLQKQEEAEREQLRKLQEKYGSQ